MCAMRLCTTLNPSVLCTYTWREKRTKEQNSGLPVSCVGCIVVGLSQVFNSAVYYSHLHARSTTTCPKAYVEMFSIIPYAIHGLCSIILRLDSRRNLPAATGAPLKGLWATLHKSVVAIHGLASE
ncbi:hypothetical protein EDD16DRAFT_559450 [Pisolithus croceorrhizus]|nr:hypothetical protein EDD16DRAFT_559450 [Pisolithus croceorrhizus]KAI6115412.1 hypothetical protein EV401DRAFT_77512 [Pisolithus croceorrhizus]KAI6164088.1 hypothetical protein EDD17DRAFT_415210 [Pisolithus thermaeus]